MRNNGHQNRRNGGRNSHSNNNNGNNRNGKGQNSLNRSYESNGPGVKVRGSAQNIAEKYIQLARDSQASGDFVAFENFMQHAEHYLRLINAAHDAMRLANPNWRPEPTHLNTDNDEGEEEQDEAQPVQQGSRRVYDINDEQPSEMQEPQPRKEFNEQPRREQRFQRPRYETTPAPSDEGLEPRPQEAQEGERRPRFNRFERNRNRNREFEPRESRAVVPVQEALPQPLLKSAQVEQENFGLPAFITAPKPAPVAVVEPQLEQPPAPRRRGRPARDTSQDIIVA
jgi:Domain of unknown function (DUF4167)